MAGQTDVSIMDAFKPPSDATPSFGNGSEGSVADDLKGSGVGGGNAAGPLVTGSGGNAAALPSGAPSKTVAVARAISPSSGPKRGVSTDKGPARARDITSKDGYIL